jgi:hypothetical protein
MNNLMVISLTINVIILVWVIILTFLYVRAIHHYRKLTAGVGRGSLQQILEKHFSHIDELEKVAGIIRKEIEEIKVEDLKHLQRVGLIRFNPFGETGGNQSFALALLDDRGNGIVISSLHSRESTRIYGKPVLNWSESGFEFSTEEKQAIERARTGD